MGGGAQISLVEYLSTTYKPDREYLDGELIERARPDNRHSKAQSSLIGLFYVLSKRHPIFPRPEL